MEQEKSCKLDFLRCNLIVFIISNRLKLCQACVVIAVTVIFINIITIIMPFIMCPR